jgi:type VI protein secretion system component VasK
MVAAAGCAKAGGAEREDGTSVASSSTPESAASAEAAFTLRQDLRELWTDHVVWTRDYIVATTSGAADGAAAVSRLMKNQEEIGGAVGRYYGSAAGDQLTSLLKDHIARFAEIAKAAKAGDEAAQNRAEDKAEKNAGQIADMLSQANPNWSRSTLFDLLKEHLKTTLAELDARLNKKWDDDVKAYDAAYDHILKMSDAIADGIVKQYPDKFTGR